jgi:hypothetical protein
MIHRAYQVTSCSTGVPNSVSIRICFDLHIKIENG